jgi:hypothetical protein
MTPYFRNMKFSIAPLSFAVAAAISLASCGNCEESCCKKTDKAVCTHASNVSFYGEEFDSKNHTFQAFNGEVDPELAHYFEGEIVESCQTMGCWMTVKNAIGDTNRVNMLDHDFFVPKQGLAGLHCRVHGHIERDTVSVEMRKHYALDAGKSQDEIDAINEPSFELSFVAYGVEIDGDREAHTSEGE